jgi:hypothetical protein
VVTKLNRDSSIVSHAVDEKAVVVQLSSVEPAGVAAVVVLWKAVPDARSYLVEQVAAGGTGDAPTVQQSVTAAGGAVSVTMSGLQPDTKYCFRLTATTPGAVSPPSDLMCTKTPAESTFPPPSGLLVTPVADTGTVQITWTPSAPNAQSILLVDGKPQEPVNGAAAQPAVSPGTHCFSVVGLAPDGSQTKPSNQSCLPVSGPATTTTAAPVTVPGSPTTVAPPTTPPAATTATTIAVAKGWLALVEAIPTADFAQTEPLQRAQRRRADFEQAGFPVNLASSDDLGLKGQPSWMLYEDGFASKDDANKACAAVAASGLITSQCIPFDSNASSATTTTTG